MKYVIAILCLASIGSIVFGYISDADYAQKFIGFGVICLFVLVFPLFSWHRWKDKKLKDYMLTQENLDKMRDFNNDSKAN